MLPRWPCRIPGGPSSELVQIRWGTRTGISSVSDRWTHVWVEDMDSDGGRRMAAEHREKKNLLRSSVTLVVGFINQAWSEINEFSVNGESSWPLLKSFSTTGRTHSLLSWIKRGFSIRPVEQRSSFSCRSVWNLHQWNINQPKAGMLRYSFLAGTSPVSVEPRQRSEGPCVRYARRRPDSHQAWFCSSSIPAAARCSPASFKSLKSNHRLH